METSYVIPGIPPEICADAEQALTAALTNVTKTRIDRAKAQFLRGRQPLFSPGNQPRDPTGKFRQVLARLKYDLGDSELDQIVSEIKNAEGASASGDYAKASEAGKNVIKMVDGIKRGVLDPESIINVREGARQLGKALAYLPLPKGDPNAKVRFSDLPPAMTDLINEMIKRVEDKIGVDKAADAVATLKSYISGVRSMASDELSGELNKLLRLLT